MSINFWYFATASFNQKSQIFQIEQNKVFWKQGGMRFSSTSI